MSFPHWWRQATGGLVATLALSLAVASVQAEDWKPISVILVRHAEKATEPKEDPPLSPAGELRAAALSKLLARAGLSAAFATDLQRTRKTAELIVAGRGIAVQALPAKDSAATVQAILGHPGETVLVVGHSNTLGPILSGLGAAEIGPIDDDDYGNVFIATVVAPGQATVVRLRL